MLERYFTVYRRIITDQPAEEVFEAVEQAMRTTVGGAIYRKDNSIEIQDGTTNLSLAFVGDLSATITLTQPEPGVIDINGTITLVPNTLFWICVVVGFCLWLPWAVNVMFFVLNPSTNYQMALDRIQLSPTDGTGS